MQCFIYQFHHIISRSETLSLITRFPKPRLYSIMPEDSKLSDFLDYMERLKNYWRLGVPRVVRIDLDDGFDLGRMRWLLQQHGNPHTNFQVDLGGTDITNVLCSIKLAASIITSVGKEHLAVLGGSLESIALAKFEIIKHGHPLVMEDLVEYHIECIIRDN